MATSRAPYNPCDHLVEQRADAPPIDRAAVRLPQQNLRSDVLGRPYGVQRAAALPQMVWAVASGAPVSFERPKSVMTTWPSRSSRMFSGFMSR